MSDQTDVPDSNDPSTAPDDQPASSPQAGRHVGDDHGAALERAARSIREAEDAEGVVAGNDDITTLDDRRAGQFSEDPDGSGGT